MPRSMTKRLRIVSVGATFVFLAMQGYEAAEYLAKAPGVFESFGSLGHSGRFLQVVGLCKLAGIVLLALAPWPTLKELLHAVFAVSAVGALVSHLSAYDSFASQLPLIALMAVQLIAFSTWRLWLRRLALRRRYSYFDEPSSEAAETRT